MTRSGTMLSFACVGMAGYGAYSVLAGFYDLAFGHQLEILPNVGLIALGLLLLPAAAFVRVLVPGGLALAVGALLGLQGLALHNDFHWYGSLVLLPQISRGVFATGLIVLAVIGARTAARSPETVSD